MNIKLLKNGAFLEAADKAFRNVFEGRETDIFEAWELVKQEIKMIAIERSAVLALAARISEREMSRNLIALLRAECERPGVGLKDIESVRAQIDELHRERYRGAIVRARSEKYAIGERPTKRALAEEKRYALRNEIGEIEYQDESSTSPNHIRKAFVDHYRNPFESQASGRRDPMFADLLKALPQLDAEEQERLEQPITLQEVERAIDDLPSAKTPGPDGLRGEFYKKFKNVLASFFLCVISEAYERKGLPPSFARTFTVSIPKKRRR